MAAHCVPVLCGFAARTASVAQLPRREYRQPLLAQEEVHLDIDAVPTAVIRDHVFRISVSESVYRTAYSALVGSTVAGAYLLPASTGVSLLFENGDTVEYYHNLYMLYLRSGADREALAAAVDGFSADDGAWVDPERAVKTQNTAAAQEFLAAMTEGESAGARLRPRLDAMYASAADPTLCLAVFLNASRSAADLYDTSLTVLIRDGEVLYMTGTWVPCIPEETYSVKTLDQLNILFSERKRHATLRNEGQIEGLAHAVQHTDAGCDIVAMERMYYMLWDDAGSLYLRPSWLLDYRLEQEDHTAIRRDVLCDGITGSVVRQTETALLPVENGK